MKTCFILFAVLIYTSVLTSTAGFAGIPYEVVLVKGKVNYKERALKRGDRIMLHDMDIKENMNKELSYFS